MILLHIVAYHALYCWIQDFYSSLWFNMHGWNSNTWKITGYHWLPSLECVVAVNHQSSLQIISLMDHCLGIFCYFYVMLKPLSCSQWDLSSNVHRHKSSVIQRGKTCPINFSLKADCIDVMLLGDIKLRKTCLLRLQRDIPASCNIIYA